MLNVIEQNTNKIFDIRILSLKGFKMNNIKCNKRNKATQEIIMHKRKKIPL